jgi:signal transduction histidine kinase
MLAPRKQSLDVELEERLPPVHADKAKLKQMLLNLLSNATKFTPDGGKLKIEAVDLPEIMNTFSFFTELPLTTEKIKQRKF